MHFLFYFSQLLISQLYQFLYLVYQLGVSTLGKVFNLKQSLEIYNEPKYTIFVQAGYNNIIERGQMKRPVLQHRQNNQRLQFPIGGDFGYQLPIGRKKYQPRPSAIHKIIFNHDLPTISREEYEDIQRYLRDSSLDSRSVDNHQNFHKYKAKMNPINNYSQVYSPEEYWQKHYSNIPRQKKGNSLPRQYSEHVRNINRLSRQQNLSPESNRKLSGNGAMMEQLAKGNSERSNSLDSLDRLVSPLSESELRLKKSKERMLDEIVRNRGKNPTYLYSQI